jgi:hypothetical protein
MINKLKSFFYFIGISWIIWIVEQLRALKKAKEEVLIDTYELNKKDIENETNNQSLNILVDSTNLLYKKPSSGNDDKAN